MDDLNPKLLANGLYELRNVIDTRTGKHHSVAQIRKSDIGFFYKADESDK